MAADASAGSKISFGFSSKRSSQLTQLSAQQQQEFDQNSKTIFFSLGGDSSLLTFQQNVSITDARAWVDSISAKPSPTTMRVRPLSDYIANVYPAIAAELSKAIVDYLRPIPPTPAPTSAPTAAPTPLPPAQRFFHVPWRRVPFQVAHNVTDASLISACEAMWRVDSDPTTFIPVPLNMPAHVCSGTTIPLGASLTINMTHLTVTRIETAVAAVRTVGGADRQLDSSSGMMRLICWIAV